MYFSSTRLLFKAQLRVSGTLQPEGGEELAACLPLKRLLIWKTSTVNWTWSENWCSSNDDDFFNRAFFLTEAEEVVLGSFSVADHFLCALSHWTASAYWGGTAWLCDNQQTCLCVHEMHGTNCDVCEWEKKTGRHSQSRALSEAGRSESCFHQ